MMKMGRAMWLVLAVLALTLSAQAQDEKAETEAKAEGKDYGKGLQVFYKLGLPDTTGGTLVRFETYDSREYAFGVAASWSVGDSMADIGWLMADEDGVATIVSISGVSWQMMSYEAAETIAEEDPDKAEALGKEGVLIGSWEKAKGDLIHEMLLEEFVDAKEMTEHLDGNINVALPFLYAAHLYRQGEKEQANTLIAECEAVVGGDIRLVLVQALDYMANTRYTISLSVLEASGDWGAFATTLEETIGAFGKGWKAVALAKELLPRVKERAEKGVPPLPGEGHSAEAVKLAEFLATSDGMYVNAYSTSGYLLPDEYDELLDDVADDEEGGEADDEDVDVEEEESLFSLVRSMRMETIPVFIALIDDTTLVPFELSTEDGDMDIQAMMARLNDGEEADEDAPQLTIPSTRGDIARAFLRSILPLAADAEPLTNEELAVAAKAFYDAHREDDMPTLALWYIAQKGTQGQTAAAWLIEQDAEAHATALEAFLVAGPGHDVWAHDGVAKTYVRKRGKAAKDFVTAYLKARRAWMADHPMGEYMDEDDHAQVEAQFEVLVEDIEPVELVRRTIADDEGFSRYAQTLVDRIAEEDDPAHLTAALQATVDEKEIDRKKRLVQIIFYACRQIERGDGGYEETLAMEQTRALWQTLLADDTELDFGEVYHLNGLVAGLIESMADPEIDEVEHDDAMKAIVLARAVARLKGTPEAELPAFPKASDIDEAGRAEMRQALMADDVDARLAALDGLTSSQKLALAEMVEDDEELAAKLSSLSRRISKLTISDELKEKLGEDATAAIMAHTGKMLTTAIVLEIRAAQVKLGDAGHGSTTSIEIVDSVQQTSIAIVDSELDPPPGFDHWVGAAMMSIPSQRARSMMLLLPAGKELEEDSSLAQFQAMVDDQEKTFDESLAELLDDAAADAEGTEIQIFIIMPDEDADDDDDEMDDKEDDDEDADDDEVEDDAEDVDEEGVIKIEPIEIDMDVKVEIKEAD